MGSRPHRATTEMAAHLLLSEQQPFSRNRHFEAHTDPRYRRAIALYRRLRALVAVLERAAADGSTVVVTPQRVRGTAGVRLDIVSERAKQTSLLDADAWEVLQRHPTARAALAAVSASA